MRQRHLIIGLALVSCAAPAAGAEEEPQKLDEETLVLEPITVTATPLEAEAGHIAQPVEVLTGEELRRKQALTIGETLAREPGISASDFGRGASRPVIRGLGGSRVRILEERYRVHGCLEPEPGPCRRVSIPCMRARSRS